VFRVVLFVWRAPARIREQSASNNIFSTHIRFFFLFPVVVFADSFFDSLTFAVSLLLGRARVSLATENSMIERRKGTSRIISNLDIVKEIVGVVVQVVVVVLIL